MARRGHPIRIEDHLPAETLRNWDEHRQSGGVEPPAGFDDPDGLWALFLACRADHTD
jgi:hypothetical protein